MKEIGTFIIGMLFGACLIIAVFYYQKKQPNAGQVFVLKSDVVIYDDTGKNIIGTLNQGTELKMVDDSYADGYELLTIKYRVFPNQMNDEGIIEQVTREHNSQAIYVLRDAIEQE